MFRDGIVKLTITYSLSVINNSPSLLISKFDTAQLTIQFHHLPKENYTIP